MTISRFIHITANGIISFLFMAELYSIVYTYHIFFVASLVAQLVKNPPAMWETWVRLLGQEDPLEEGMTTHSIAWRIPWTEEPGGLQSMGSQRLGHD